jgi:hypothetical protein
MKKRYILLVILVAFAVTIPIIWTPVANWLDAATKEADREAKAYAAWDAKYPAVITNSTTYGVVSTDAPYGRYWVETYAHGAGGFLIFVYNAGSMLVDSYTIRYLLPTGEMKTAIFDSQNSSFHIYLLNSTKALWYNISQNLYRVDNCPDAPKYYDAHERYFWPIVYSYNLYIPDPKLFNTTEAPKMGATDG